MMMMIRTMQPRKRGISVCVGGWVGEKYRSAVLFSGQTITLVSFHEWKIP